MSRWRAPREKSSPYITPRGYQALEKELEDIWRKRAEVTRALSAAAAEGDRSENAEYIYRKKELRGIDSRIGYLQRRMPELNIVTSVSDSGRVFFGARVCLETETGEQVCYRIIGADELGEEPENISVDSPVARALLGKCLDEEVNVQVGDKTHSYCLVSIDYPDDGGKADGSRKAN